METVAYHIDMMKRLHRCPVCEGPLQVLEYQCGRCGTRIVGTFPRTEFDQLSEEQLHFLRLFLQFRGNLSMVAQELGVSRPTARARLDEVLNALGYPSLAEPVVEEEVDVEEVLDRLERGEITVEEAERLLKGET